MKPWKVIDTGSATARDNMAIDLQLLEKVALDKTPIIHLYEWTGLCATYGYFTNPENHLRMERVNAHQLELARRPTGGGIIFHMCDLAFSVIVPSDHPNFSLNTLENYGWINQAVIAAISNMTNQALQGNLYACDNSCEKKSNSDFEKFCMAKPTVYDVMIGDKKVGGAAQRRTKAGLLHQGSISIAMPPQELLEDLLINGDEIIKAMHQYSCTLLPASYTREELQRTRSALQNELINFLKIQHPTY